MTAHRSPTPKTHKSRSHKTKKRRRSPDQHPNVMISGYYGFDNLGDELILQVLIDALKERKAHITVLSQNPEKTRQQYGVDAISRTSILDIVEALAQTHLFISGGGGLFQDATGPMSALYYGGLIHLAAFLQVPVCFWAQGVGPLRQWLPRKVTASALEKCEAIVVRDESSADVIESLIGRRPMVTADPVWLLKTEKSRLASVDLPKMAKANKGTEATGSDASEASDSTSELAAKPPVKPGQPFRIGVSLRPWKDLNDTRLNNLAACIHKYSTHLTHLNRPIEFWLLPFQQSEDVVLLKNFATRLSKQGATTVVVRSPEQALQDVGDCDVLFGMRFHSLILGLLNNVPIYGLPYDPKVASLLETFKLRGTSVKELNKLTGLMLLDAFDSYPTIQLKPLQKRSQRNLFLLDELLAIPDVELVL
jgi:polysaccharide pyruvyl transferase CsaB